MSPTRFDEETTLENAACARAFRTSAGVQTLVIIDDAFV